MDQSQVCINVGERMRYYKYTGKSYEILTPAGKIIETSSSFSRAKEAAYEYLRNKKGKVYIHQVLASLDNY